MRTVVNQLHSLLLPGSFQSINEKNNSQVIALVAILYVVACGLLFIFQEKLIFFPQKLAGDHKFEFPQKFEEINITAGDNKILHGILFRADSSKGLIFYLHGNAGSLSSWGDAASTYTDLNYDVFMLDYRGYGKSEGMIRGEEEIFQDVQVVYEKVKQKYAENKIIVLGYSVGTGSGFQDRICEQSKVIDIASSLF
jgi:uncharacterized protein